MNFVKFWDERVLIHVFPKHPSLTPEGNMSGGLMFSGGEKEHMEKNWVNLSETIPRTQVSLLKLIQSRFQVRGVLRTQ